MICEGCDGQDRCMKERCVLYQEECRHEGSLKKVGIETGVNAGLWWVCEDCGQPIKLIKLW